MQQGAWAAEKRACAGVCKPVSLGAIDRRVLDVHKEIATTDGGLADPGPEGWPDKGAHASLRSRVKPARLDPRPRLACAPFSTQRRPVSLPPRLQRGFTLVEVLVALFVLALMASLSWRGLDGMVRTRQAVEGRADEILSLQTGLAQWTADLEAIEEFPPAPALGWNGRVLRLTRRSSLAPGDGVRVVGWTAREGRWLRWQSQPVYTRGDLETAWQQADLWSQNPSDAMRQQEVAITPLENWQIFFFRGDAWTNPLSSDASQQQGSVRAQLSGGAVPSAGTLPDGVRLVLDLPAGHTISGRLQRDWVRPTVAPGRP
jgi:general secretion pathway protein J